MFLAILIKLHLLNNKVFKTLIPKNRQTCGSCYRLVNEQRTMLLEKQSKAASLSKTNMETLFPQSFTIYVIIQSWINNRLKIFIVLHIFHLNVCGIRHVGTFSEVHSWFLGFWHVEVTNCSITAHWLVSLPLEKLTSLLKAASQTFSVCQVGS